MAGICAACGGPGGVCMCEELAQEQQMIRGHNDTRRYGKTVTVVEGLNVGDIDIAEEAVQGRVGVPQPDPGADPGGAGREGVGFPLAQKLRMVGNGN